MSTNVAHLEYRHTLEVSEYKGILVLCDMSFRPRSSGEPAKGMGTMADALLPASPLVLPRCKTWWSPSPGTTCWR